MPYPVATLKPIGSASQITASTTFANATCDAHPPDGTKGWLITVTGNPVYMSTKGTTPSSTVGINLVKDVSPIFLPLGEVAMSFVGNGGNGTVNIIFLGN